MIDLTAQRARCELDNDNRGAIRAGEAIGRIERQIAEEQAELTTCHNRRADIAAKLQNLEAARREAESLRRGSGSAALDDKSAEGDDLLRKAIVELGAEMLRVSNSRKIPARGSPVAPKSGPASLSPAPNPGRSAAAGE